MLKIGLTGGIACGKSYALRRFQALGANTVDADQIAREVVQPGQPALAEIEAEFGAEMLLDDGTLDRVRLGRLIFSDEGARRRLNGIIHPYILEWELRRMESIASRGPDCPLVIVDAALMIEAGSHARYDLLVVVYCRPEIQRRRLQLRDGLSEQEARLRIDSQMPTLEKVRLADYVIETSGTAGDTDDQVRQVFLELLHRYEEGLTRENLGGD